MKIYKMNDCEWWRAASLEDAIATMMKDCGMTREQVLEDEPCELSEEEMDKLIFVQNNPDEEEPVGGWPEHSFREQCRQEDELGMPAGVFAATADCQ